MQEVVWLFCMLVLLRGLVSTQLTDASILHPGRLVGWWSFVIYEARGTHLQ